MRIPYEQQELYRYEEFCEWQDEFPQKGVRRQLVPERVKGCDVEEMPVYAQSHQ